MSKHTQTRVHNYETTTSRRFRFGEFLFQQPKNTRSNNGAQYRVVQGPKSTHHMPMPFLEGTFLCSCLPDTSRACSHKPHVGTCPSDTKVALLFYRHAEPCHCILLLSCHRRPAVLIRSVPTRTDVLSLGLDLPAVTTHNDTFSKSLSPGQPWQSRSQMALECARPAPEAWARNSAEQRSEV